MGYFKRRKERLRKEALTEALSLVSTETILHRKKLERDIERLKMKANAQKLEHEENLRNSLSAIMPGTILANELMLEVAEVINNKSKEYGYRIAKNKREKLAMDILNELCVKK